MISKIATTQPFAGVSADTSSPAPFQATGDQPAKATDQPKQAAPVKAPEPQQEPLLRLEIKHDGQGRYVYTLTDRNTGRTVVEIPRETLDQIGSEPTYNAGDVVSTKA